MLSKFLSNFSTSTLRKAEQELSNIFLIFLLLLIGLGLPAHANQVSQIKTIAPQSSYDVSHHYFTTLLQNILESTAAEYGPSQVVYSSQMEQGRALYELTKGSKLDVYWAGTSISRERTLIPIRIPLLKGLLGFRASIIRAEDEEKFKAITSLEQLQELTACQGAHWPDSDILENAGMAVRRNPVYEHMFAELAEGRCDFFPRGIHEGGGEVAARLAIYPNLKLFTDFVIYYPFPMYFFVSSKNPELAERISKGLEANIDSGSLDQHLQNHPVTSRLFPMKQWKDKQIFVLDNPLLPRNTPTENNRYWITP
ncbi:hypothetical protein ACMXYW_06470 [Neptuniibacter sp. QD48_55]|uniref:hypothetical protein n=1 Tax=Neptuniibacter sp. QD48_55 TaxID=3398212 RepID=UPI0039F48C58